MTSRKTYEMLCVATICVTMSWGCGGKAKTKSTPAPATPAASAQAVPAAAQKGPAGSPHVGVSDDLVAKCKLRFANMEQAPKFGFNDSDLLPSDRDVLQQVADCLTRGPLQGRSVELIGRTDPRGTDEYNLGLGSKRAYSVKTYLERLGVPSARLSPTTKGEIDASGRDETTWQRDRRVDLQLVN
jgi:peptidoglycan-associated lipoprotein